MGFMLTVFSASCMLSASPCAGHQWELNLAWYHLSFSVLMRNMLQGWSLWPVQSHMVTGRSHTLSSLYFFTIYIASLLGAYWVVRLVHLTLCSSAKRVSTAVLGLCCETEAAQKGLWLNQPSGEATRFAQHGSWQNLILTFAYWIIWEASAS